MKTSNFANWQRNRFPGAISISRSFKNGEIDWTGYNIAYRSQLDMLDPTSIWEALHELAGPHEPVLLCVESAKTLEEKPCHRRLVADWFEYWIDDVIEEWSKEVELK